MILDIRDSCQENNGFTLIEVLVGVGIFSLLIAGIVAMLLFSWKSNKIIWEQLSTQNEGRKVAQDFVNELRTATYSSTGAYPLESVSTTQIIFFANIDNDTARERVRYFKSGMILKKGVIKPTGVPLSYNLGSEIVTNVVYDVANTSTPLFYYYDQNYTSGTPMTYPINITSVRMAGINLMIEEDPNTSPVPFFIEAKTEIRNLKSN